MEAKGKGSGSVSGRVAGCPFTSRPYDEYCEATSWQHTWQPDTTDKGFKPTVSESTAKWPKAKGNQGEVCDVVEVVIPRGCRRFHEGANLRLCS